MPFTTPLVGASDTATRTSQIASTFKPGHSAIDDKNRTWVYVGPANGAIAAAGTLSFDANFVPTAGAGNYTADLAFANGEYGWVRKTASPL